MLATLVIVFREVFEAGLAIGIVAAALGHAPKALRYIWGGVGAGVVASIIVAIFAGRIADFFGGFGQEMLNAGILILAVVMLGWHTIWMARHGRELAQNLKALGHEAATGARPMMAVAIVVATSVLREGSEVVLFLYGAAASSGATAVQSLIGGAFGLLAGGLVSFVTYKGIVRIPMRWVFSVTTGLLTLLAAGMAAQAAHFLQAAGAVEALSNELWDLSGILPESGIAGIFLKALMGYSDRPTALMMLAFFATLIVFVAGTRMITPRANKPVAA
ncbi:MAG: FTR1 family protein [Alphaproteobacteria bacterium]|nr:FTR1 family protein [Alphaproteobacteria bacterium]